MNTVSNPRLPQVTRWLVYLIMGLMTLLAAGIVLGGILLPIYWTDVVAEIADKRPKLDTGTLLPLVYAIFAFALVMLGMVWTIMKKLLALLNSVEVGDPFILENAVRLKSIGWMMVGLQLLAIPLAALAKITADMFGKNDVNYDFPLNGLLAILLVFILADIFKRGAEMRDELEGTV